MKKKMSELNKEELEFMNKLKDVFDKWELKEVYEELIPPYDAFEPTTNNSTSFISYGDYSKQDINRIGDEVDLVCFSEKHGDKYSPTFIFSLESFVDMDKEDLRLLYKEGKWVLE